jgi:hypothetical protein
MEGAASIILIPAAVIVVCVLIFSLFFKAEVTDWMRRTTKAGPVEFAPASTQQQAAAAEHGSDKPLITEAPPSDPSLAPWQADVEEAVRRENTQDKDELIGKLIISVALARRASDFNVAARLIFGSQIAALRTLASSPDGLTLEDLRPIYTEHQTRLLIAGSNEIPDILQWISFLLGQRLVAMRNGHYHITEAAKVFLAFLNSIGMSEAKAY